ncbi:MAG TPA: hypothetical protein DEB06_10700 [Phycisphaerales bacterium]|nr:hypothetical protein [Phycisphaerales bacterium]
MAPRPPTASERTGIPRLNWAIRAALAPLLGAVLSLAGCTGVQSFVQDVRDLGPAFSAWGEDAFGSSAPEY